MIGMFHDTEVLFGNVEYLQRNAQGFNGLLRSQTGRSPSGAGAKDGHKIEGL
jgi:hypothetical protein